MATSGNKRKTGKVTKRAGKTPARIGSPTRKTQSAVSKSHTGKKTTAKPAAKKEAVKKPVAGKKTEKKQVAASKAAAKKSVTAKKAPPAKKTLAKKSVTAKKAPPAKKTLAKKSVTAKKAPPAKKTLAKKAVTTKKAPPAKKTSAKKSVTAKKAPLAKKAPAADANKNLKAIVKVSAQKEAIKVPSHRSSKKEEANVLEPPGEVLPLKTYDEFYGASNYEAAGSEVSLGFQSSDESSQSEDSVESSSSVAATEPEETQDLAKWYRLTEEGAAAFDIERYAVAEICFVDALKIVDKTADGAHSNEEKVRITKSLNNLAALYHVQGKYSMAEELYERCLDMKLSLYGEEHLEVAVNLHNLAVLHSAKRSFLRAEILYKRALEVREKLLGAMHPELVPILRNYALLLKKTRRESESLQLEERARLIKGQLS